MLYFISMSQIILTNKSFPVKPVQQFGVKCLAEEAGKLSHSPLFTLLHFVSCYGDLNCNLEAKLQLSFDFVFCKSQDIYVKTELNLL